MIKKYKLKIGFFAPAILENGGGLEKYLIETASSLSSPKIKADVITMDTDFTLKMAFLLQIFYLKKITRADLFKEKTSSIIKKLGKSKYIKCKTFSELRKVFSKYDVIYSKNEIFEAFIFKFILGYKLIPPVIFGVHTPHFYPIAKSCHAKLHNFLYGSALYSFLVSGVNYFHVFNQESSDRLSLQFPNKNIIRISHPFDVQGFNKKINKYRFEHHINKNKPNILWLARLNVQKGVNDLIQIIDQINADGYSTKINWHIAGEGGDRNRIEYLVKKWSNVIYYGHVENNYVASLLSKIDLFISTSQWEADPYNIIEAQAVGKPVFAYKIAGPMDIIEIGKTGMLINDIPEFIKTIKEFISNNQKYDGKLIRETIRRRTDVYKINRELTAMFYRCKKS